MFQILALLLVALAAPVNADPFWQKVSWTTKDGVVLVGVYHPATNPKAYTWVLMHGLGANKEEWEAFSQKLAQQGPGVFLYDARGHNESTHKKDGTPISYLQWQLAGPGTEWEHLPGDLESAVKLLRKKFDVPEKKIAVGGASLGANVALVYASAHPQVPALILLSAGIEYAGMNIQEPWRMFKPRPVFAAASPRDSYAYSTLQFIVQQRPDVRVRFLEGPDGAHGVKMFADPKFESKVLAWFQEID